MTRSKFQCNLRIAFVFSSFFFRVYLIKLIKTFSHHCVSLNLRPNQANINKSSKYTAAYLLYEK